MSNKISFNFSGERFADFLKKLKDLSSIDECIKIKIDKDNILLYTMITNNSTVTALKNYTLKTSDYIVFDQDFTLDYIISNAPKVMKSLSILSNDDDHKSDVKLDIVYKKDADCMHVRTGLFTSNKLKIACVGAEMFKIRDISLEILDAKLNIDYADWNFVVNKMDFTNVKKLAAIYSDNKVIDITISDNIVKFSESSKWDLIVGESTDSDYHTLVFVKKYLSNIDDSKEDIIFYVYDSFILIKDDNSNLMLSYEQSWDE